MKIEFIKETRHTGEVFYCTEIDGTYVPDSISTIEETGRSFYNAICRGKQNQIEILETFEIN